MCKHFLWGNIVSPNIESEKASGPIKNIYGASARASHWLNISLPLYCL